METVPIQVGTMLAPPNSYVCTTKTLLPNSDLDCFKPGAAAESIGEVLARLKLPYQITHHKPTSWGVKDENGTWTGMLGLIDSGEVDIGSITFFPTPVRLKDFYATFPIQFNDDPALLIPKSRPNVMNSATLVLTIFTVDLWVTLFAMSMFFALLTTVFYRYDLETAKTDEEPEEKLTSPVWALIRVVVPKAPDPYMRFNFISGTCFWIIIGLTVTLFHELYQGQLRGTLLSPKRPPSFSGPEQVLSSIASGQLQLWMTHEGTFYTDEIRKGESGFMKGLKEATETAGKPYRVSEDYDFLKQVISNGSGVLLGDRYVLQEVLHGACSIDVMMIPEFRNFVAVVFLRKNFEYRERISEMFVQMMGQLQVIEQKYISNPDTCEDETPSSNDKGPPALSMLHMSGALSIWITGLIIALITLLSESVIVRIANYRRKIQSEEILS